MANLFYHHIYPSPHSTPFPYTTLFRSVVVDDLRRDGAVQGPAGARPAVPGARRLAGEGRLQGVDRRARAARVGRSTPGDGRTDRKSTRLNSSHVRISYAVFCMKKKTKQ